MYVQSSQITFPGWFPPSGLSGLGGDLVQAPMAPVNPYAGVLQVLIKPGEWILGAWVKAGGPSPGLDLPLMVILSAVVWIGGLWLLLDSK